MEEESLASSVADGDPPVVTEVLEPSTCNPPATSLLPVSDGNESGVVVAAEGKPRLEQHESLAEDARSLPELEESGLGAAGSDSGVEGCGGRALSSGGGEQSCASSVVSCGSESSSLGSAAGRRRRPGAVSLAEPPPQPRRPPASSTPRAPHLATKDRARSREKPAIPEKPRPLTPKPRIRPNADLPCLVRESPALRAKPTKTSTARCRTPSSPSEAPRWPPSSRMSSSTESSSAATRVAADKYGTLPRRRREDGAGSPRQDARRAATAVTRSLSTRCATRTRVRIYAEKVSQTVLVGADIEAALAGVTPNIECGRGAVSVCSRGVQASGRSEAAAAAAAETARARADAAAARERAARRAAEAELQRNNERLLELAGAAAGSGADGCLVALEEQLRAAGELTQRQRAEIDALRRQNDALQAEAHKSREAAAAAEARLSEVERESAEMQDFLSAETAALNDSLREADAELASYKTQLDQSLSECRQLVRVCEVRRQEALAGAGGAAAAAAALAGLAHRLRALAQATRTHSRSESAELLSPSESGGGLVCAVSRALRLNRSRADLSRGSDDIDTTADLIDSETEPCFGMDPEWSESSPPAWSGCNSPLSPPAATASLHSLSTAIVRQRGETAAVRERARQVHHHLTQLLANICRHAGDGLREKLEASDQAADASFFKMLDLDGSNPMLDQYRTPGDTSERQSIDQSEENNLDDLEEELSSLPEWERRERYEALDSAVTALASRGAAVARWPRLTVLLQDMERLAFALAATPAKLPHRENGHIAA